ncbi:MAG: tetratricopeptide repeat protein [Candidatus Sumerlaeaceae bacterium]
MAGLITRKFPLIVLVYLQALFSYGEGTSNTISSRSALSSSDDRTSGAASSADLHQAQKAYREGRYSQAILIYEKYLAEHPEDDDQRIQLAKNRAAMKQYDTATKILEEVISRNPSAADALLIRGNVRLWQRNFTAARLDLEAVIKQAPDYCDAYIALAKSYFWDGNATEALARLKQAPATCAEGRDYTALRQQIEAALKTGTQKRDSKPRASHSSRADRSPSSPAAGVGQEDFDALIRQAQALTKQQDFAGAEAIADHILSVKPDHADALLMKGLVSLWTERTDEAEYWFRRTLKAAPHYCEAFYGLSNVFIKHECYDQAFAIVLQNPRCQCQAEAIEQLGRVENADGNYASARHYFARALNLDPHNEDFRINYRMLNLFTNTSIANYESYRLTGDTFNLSNVLTYRPCKQYTWSASTEYWHRFGQSDERVGVGLTWHPCEDLWLHNEALVALREEIVPSRYNTELTYRFIRDPGTAAILGASYYHSRDSRAASEYAGIRQSLCEFWNIEYRRMFSQQLEPTSEQVQSDSFRLTYEKEKERIVSMGLTRGGEAFSESRLAGAGTVSGTYDAQTVFATWREWVCPDRGWLASVSSTQRSNGNDSRAIGLGLFLEF